MKALWAPIIFAAGLGAGLLISSGGTRETSETAGNKSAAPVVRKRGVRPAKTPHEAKFRSFAKELPTLSPDDREAFYKSITPRDRTAVIEAMLAQTGPEGIPSLAQSMISHLITAWAGEDFERAWSWCQRIEGDANRIFIAKQLLNQGAQQNPERAYALHQEIAAGDPSFISTAPTYMLQHATTKDAASFLDILGKMPFSGGTSGMEGHFAADFDFQQAADGVTALKNSHGGAPSVFPNNFLSSWAERDADAAYAWLPKNESDYYVNFGRVLEGIAKRGVPGACYVWAAEKFNEPGADRGAIIRPVVNDPLAINAIAQAMPDTASRDGFLGDVASMADVSDPAIHLSHVLTQMSSPAARLDTLLRIGKRNRLDPAKISDAQLQLWGLTRQQVEQAQSAGR